MYYDNFASFSHVTFYVVSRALFCFHMWKFSSTKTENHMCVYIVHMWEYK